MINNPLLCTVYKKRKFNGYRGFRLSSVKLLCEYLFTGHVIKINQNSSDLCYDIFLCKRHKEKNTEINFDEVKRFMSYYGKGFNVTIFEQKNLTTYE